VVEFVIKFTISDFYHWSLAAVIVFPLNTISDTWYLSSVNSIYTDNSRISG